MTQIGTDKEQPNELEGWMTEGNRPRVRCYNGCDLHPVAEIAFFMRILRQLMQILRRPTEYDKLLDAINDGEVSEAKRIIETGFDLNVPCDEGATPLYAAVLNGHSTLVRLMLERGADPNFLAGEPAAFIYAEKPLDLAMQARFLIDWDRFHPIVKMLVEYGATDVDGNAETASDLDVRERRAREHQRRSQLEFGRRVRGCDGRTLAPEGDHSAPVTRTRDGGNDCNQ